ncbi:tetratricopeptide repeat protein [Streptomyces sp. NPDC002688]|uniref:tetratricopeptide repeat protein n=1 Tax=Streptomyces sp. NPDC002688 TaxID=3154423 RepID=UPI0033347858
MHDRLTDLRRATDQKVLTSTADINDTLAGRNNLASVYREAGDLGRAIPLYETTLAQREQILGDTHPHTLNSRNKLAGVRQKTESVQHGSAATSVADAAPQEPSTLIEQPENHQ